MAEKVLDDTALDKVARHIAPEGVQNYTEIREILEKHADYTAKFIQYQDGLESLKNEINDPNIKLRKEIKNECEALDHQQDDLAKAAPDERISIYLISCGHLLGSKHQEDPHYQKVQKARAARSLFSHAAGHVEPCGGNLFSEVKAAFLQDAFYTGEFLGYIDAVERFQKDIIITHENVTEARWKLLEQLYGELIERSIHAKIKTYLLETQEKIIQLNDKVK